MTELDPGQVHRAVRMLLAAPQLVAGGFHLLEQEPLGYVAAVQLGWDRGCGRLFCFFFFPMMMKWVICPKLQQWRKLRKLQADTCPAKMKV